MERLTALAVPRRGEPFLVVPRLEAPMVDASPAGALGLEVLTWDETDDPFALLARAATAGWGAAPERVAVGRPHLGAARARRRRRAARGGPGAGEPGGRPAADGEDAGRGRRARRRRAAIDRVHARMGEWLRAGRTEAEVGADIAAAILAEGHVSVDFTIVGSGPNGASPHHELSDRVVEDGDVVVVDIGGETATGYRSDCTRTYAVGRAPAPRSPSGTPSCRRRSAPRPPPSGPGVTAEQVDAAARDVIARPGGGSTSSTAPGTASAWTPTRRPTSSRATTCRWSRAWRSPSSRASTCRAAAAPASRTSSSAPPTASPRSTRAA
jgi:hypothetical protein